MRCCISFGSCGSVIACKSTIKNKHSCSFCSAIHCFIAPKWFPIWRVPEGCMPERMRIEMGLTGKSVPATILAKLFDKRKERKKMPDIAVGVLSALVIFCGFLAGMLWERKEFEFLGPALCLFAFGLTIFAITVYGIEARDSGLGKPAASLELGTYEVLSSTQQVKGS